MIRFLFILIFLIFPLPAKAQSPAPVVLELFTSQACAFCPPADALMGQMAEQQNIIGLSCHVDYFGVKQKSLGKNFCTRRQNQYGKLIGKGPRYTPQLVVNGHMDMIGYETGRVSAAVMKARAEKMPSIQITPVGGDNYNYVLPGIGMSSGEVRIWLAVYDAPQTIAMTEGNNFGKKLTYVNVVSHMDDLGLWDGNTAARTVSASLLNQNKGFAIVAQNISNGRILAAGSFQRQHEDQITSAR